MNNNKKRALKNNLFRGIQSTMLDKLITDNIWQYLFWLRSTTEMQTWFKKLSCENTSDMECVDRGNVLGTFCVWIKTKIKWKCHTLQPSPARILSQTTDWITHKMSDLTRNNLSLLLVPYSDNFDVQKAHWCHSNSMHTLRDMSLYDCWFKQDVVIKCFCTRVLTKTGISQKINSDEN